jgi:acetoacetyl-CoA synthetase
VTSRTSTMIETLTPIWQRVLQLSSIGVEDNFFDLGGDSSLAVQLFAEIAQVCGRELPPVMIYHAPTIAALAALLEQPATSGFPPLVLLKPGPEEPPVFIAHGLGGSAMDFFQVVKHIEVRRPIYGMQARGIDGVDEPFDSIEDMAQFHLDAIKNLQPHGPYVLIGYSLGGLVALEMAQRLSANGEKIALLAMLDAYPYIGFLSPGQRVQLIARQARQRASTLTRMPMRDAVSYSSRLFERGLRAFGDLSGSASYQAPMGVSYSPAMQRVRDSAYLALTRYRPRFYPGKISFVRAEINTDFPHNAAAVWNKLANEVEVETVPGDHLGIVTTHFESLASALSRYLTGAFPQR